MKYELQTIPVWDALKKDGECLLCSLMETAETDAVSFYLGSSVMNPETRVQVNNTGFCPYHLQMLSESRKPQSLSVMLRSVLEVQSKALEKPFSQALSSKPGRSTEKAIQSIFDTIEGRESGCLICRKMNDRLIRYCYTIAVLYKTDAQFKSALLASHGFCLNHFQKVLEISAEALNTAERNQFLKDMVTLEERALSEISSDVEWMTQKYKSENFDKPWNGCEDAHKRASYKLIGHSRIQNLDDK